MNAYEDVERLAETVRRYGNSPAGLNALDDILVKCRAYMEPDQTDPCQWLNAQPATRRMFDLLLKRRGQAVSASALYDTRVSRWDGEPDIKIVAVYICHLRKSLEGTEYEGMIESVWGKGYRLRNAEEGPISHHTNKSRHYKPSAAAPTNQGLAA